MADAEVDLKSSWLWWLAKAELSPAPAEGGDPWAEKDEEST